MNTQDEGKTWLSPYKKYSPLEILTVYISDNSETLGIHIKNEDGSYCRHDLEIRPIISALSNGGGKGNVSNLKAAIDFKYEPVLDSADGYQLGNSRTDYWGAMPIDVIETLKESALTQHKQQEGVEGLEQAIKNMSSWLKDSSLDFPYDDVETVLSGAKKHLESYKKQV